MDDEVVCPRDEERGMGLDDAALVGPGTHPSDGRARGFAHDIGMPRYRAVNYVWEQMWENRGNR